MSTRFAPLRDYLCALDRDEVVLTFAEMEQILGVPLSASAFSAEWWRDGKRSWQDGLPPWTEAGFVAKLIPGIGAVCFTRPPQAIDGLAERPHPAA